MIKGTPYRVKSPRAATGYEIIRLMPGKTLYNLAGGYMYCTKCGVAHPPYEGP